MYCVIVFSLQIPKNPSKKYNNKQLRKAVSESVNDEITINNDNNNNNVNEVNKLETLNHSTGINNIIEDNNTNLQQANTIINDIGNFYNLLFLTN